MLTRIRHYNNIYIRINKAISHWRILIFFLNFFPFAASRFFFVCAITVALMTVQTKAAPKFQHQMRHHTRFQSDEDHKQKLDWVNPCRVKYVATTSLSSDQTNEINQPTSKEIRQKSVSGSIKNYISGNVLLVVVVIFMFIYVTYFFSPFLHCSWVLCKRSWKIISFVWTVCRTPLISVTFRYGLYTIKHLNFCHELMYQLPV